MIFNMQYITSKNNSKIKEIINIRDNSKFRNDKSLYYVEGERILNDTPNSLINSLYISKSKLNLYNNILSKVDINNVYVLNDDVFDKIKDTKNSQGIVGIINYNNIKSIDKTYISLINSCLILDSINDPGNLGTIFRLAEATNINLIILTKNCCSVFNSKVIRACMSSLFRVNFYISDNIIDDIKLLKNENFKIYSAVLDIHSIKYNDISFNTKYAIVLGNEANGVSLDIQNISDNKIYIPMCGKIESLNVAIAASAICYEAMKQNNFYET